MDQDLSVTRNLMLSVGPPLLNRYKSRVQTKCEPKEWEEQKDWMYTACIRIPGTQSRGQALWLANPHNSVELMWSHLVGSTAVKWRLSVRCNAICAVGMWRLKWTRYLQLTLALGMWDATCVNVWEEYRIDIAGPTSSKKYGLRYQSSQLEVVSLLLCSYRREASVWCWHTH